MAPVLIFAAVVIVNPHVRLIVIVVAPFVLVLQILTKQIPNVMVAITVVKVVLVKLL